MITITVRHDATDPLSESHNIFTYDADVVPRKGDIINYYTLDGDVDRLIVNRVEWDIAVGPAGVAIFDNVTVFVSYEDEGDERPC